jgi:tetratricopeptide (TPR) repeat protein
MNSSAQPTATAQWFQEAVRLHQSGRVLDAERLYLRVLEVQRDHFDALHLLGVCLHQRGDFAGAQRQLRAVLKLRPDVAAAHLSYGNVLREMHRIGDAVDSYTRAVRLDPELAIAHFNLGTAFEEMGRHAAALASYEHALARQADATALTGKANCLHALGRSQEALGAYRMATDLDPRHADAHANLGAVLLALQRYDEAFSSVERALALRPDHSGALLNRAIILTELGRPGESLQSLAALGAAGPTGAQALYQQARALAGLRRPGESLAVLDKVLAMEPGHRGARLEKASGLMLTGRIDEAQSLVDTLLSERSGDRLAILYCGLLAFARGELARARTEFDRFREAEPQNRLVLFALSLLDLLEGDLASGWARFESRWEDPAMRVHRPRFAQPVWLGEDVIGDQTLFVHAEQGAGDTLHFCRYLPLVLTRARRVVFGVPRPFLSLMRRSLPADITVVPQDKPLPPFDRHCPLLSLPLAFGTRLPSIPAMIPYLTADPDRITVWRNRLGEDAPMRVGLAWSGNPQHAHDFARSIALADLLPLLRAGLQVPQLRRVQFIALQNDLRTTDRAALASAPALQYFGEAIQDFDDTAALASLCDLVIAVDTAAAHLAGAMGRPLWVLLPFVPDWRWLLERSDSPWYPSARLFRQASRAAWDPVIAQVTQALAHHVQLAEGPESIRIAQTGSGLAS